MCPVPTASIDGQIPRPALYVVKWQDILIDCAWVGVNPEKVMPALCVTVGWIVHSSEAKVVMADSKTADGDWGGVTVIPTGVIVERKRITARPPESFLRKSPAKKGKAKG